jgi:hypothetical protein
LEAGGAFAAAIAGKGPVGGSFSPIGPEPDTSRPRISCRLGEED